MSALATGPAPVLTIYYDAACPLCATEMQALARASGPLLLLRDCGHPDFDDAQIAAAGITRADLLRCIHAKDEDGQWLKGVDVFVRAYRLAGLDGVSQLFAHRRLRPLWDRFYPWVARHRMALSRLHLHLVFGWLLDRAARRAQGRQGACGPDGCRIAG